MARGEVPTEPPVFSQIDYGARVKKSWGDEWHKPEIAYQFGRRVFRDSGIYGGAYIGTRTS